MQITREFSWQRPAVPKVSRFFFNGLSKYQRYSGGVKLSAQHVEEDIDAALEVGVDYIILDGRRG